MTRPPPIGTSRTASTRGRSRFARALMGAWLAVQVLVVAAVPIADAQADHTERIVAHWDDAQERNCPPLHDPSACRLCQVVSATFGGPAGPALAPVRLVAVAAPLPDERGISALAAALRASPRPRGPPSA
ncbi:MAG: hypothetical protein K8S21_10420 [Gemmatimonadetes bacterium]|nr:hypothetical protein [Gemmatimonadota bacterium]